MVMNAYASIEELQDIMFSMQSVSYFMKERGVGARVDL
jgi:hypothetical protein